jgi:hypothetical protein
MAVQALSDLSGFAIHLTEGTSTGRDPVGGMADIGRENPLDDLLPSRLMRILSRKNQAADPVRGAVSGIVMSQRRFFGIT